MRATKRLLKRQNERKRKLAQAGIKYDFEAVGYVSFFRSSPPSQKLITFTKKKANLVES